MQLAGWEQEATPPLAWVPSRWDWTPLAPLQHLRSFSVGSRSGDGWGYYLFFFFPLLKGAGEAECGDPREKVPSRVKEAALGSRSKAGHSLRREGSNEDSQEKGARGTQVEDAGG